MKRRNAESGKMRRPVKRTKITEGMYGNSMLYLKFIMLWATVVMADYMMDFRFEFLWPFWMMLLALNHAVKYKGVVYTMFFIGVSLSSDIICYLFIPLQYIFFAASTHVWVQYVWYTFADKGVCLPTVALCCLVVYVEGALRSERGPGLELCRPLAAHCLAYPMVRLGLAAKSLIDLRYRICRLGHERTFDELCMELLKDTPSDGTAEQLEKIEEHLTLQVMSLTNGHAAGSNDIDPPHEPKVSTKSSKSEKKDLSTAKEEKKKSKNKDKDRDSGDSHKSTDHKKDQIYKDLESTKEVVKNHKDSNSNREEYRREEKEQKERDRETREREKERDKELRERERERREARECLEELVRVRAELAAARAAEGDARRALHAALADKQLAAKVTAWKCTEKLALEKKLSEARKARALAESQLLRAKTTTPSPSSGECEGDWCKSRLRAQQAEALALRRDVQRARDKAARLAAELHAANQQVRTLESRNSEESSGNSRLAGAWQALQERAAHLERSLSAETRVKLDLLSALGEAKRTLHWQDDLISKQEKEIEELKVQMLAVMPTEYVAPMSNPVSKLRFPEGSLNPNATVYTPR